MLSDNCQSKAQGSPRPGHAGAMAGPRSKVRAGGVVALVFFISLARAAVPGELAEALKNFRSDPLPGWSYTMTTAGEGKSLVERCNAARPEFDRWSLLLKDGRAPTPD